MAKQDIYMIVGDMENGFRVERKDEPAGNGMWWATTVYTCEKKGKEGYEEAKRWINEQGEQQ